MTRPTRRRLSADPLPTVQIDGVVWSQTVVGNTVYVGGEFTTARPAGAAPGVNTVPRANLLAYDVRTGVLIDSWAPTTNGEVLSSPPPPTGPGSTSAASSPHVNGQTRNRIVALNPTTGAIIQSFAVVADASVRAIVATDTTVYLGGLSTSLNGATRSRAGAVSAADGSVLPWAPVAAGGSVCALAADPGRQQGRHRRQLHDPERVDQPRLRSGSGRPRHRRVAAVGGQQRGPQRPATTVPSPRSRPTVTRSTPPATRSAATAAPSREQRG